LINVQYLPIGEEMYEMLLETGKRAKSNDRKRVRQRRENIQRADEGAAGAKVHAEKNKCNG